MTRKKLKLDELKVQSFVTELSPELARTAKGGDDDATKPLVTCIIEISIKTYEATKEVSFWQCSTTKAADTTAATGSTASPTTLW
ncbi:pinensin family lanthipeptide [Chitinophaga sp. RAB17]|uniref:pinensin family lanthipeptide n=1 Tax=Chitinophaga sp. RAB17 TaxID=3233049 RepID=UPI003F8DD43E